MIRLVFVTLAGILALPAAPVQAQEEIPLALAPRPDQTVRLTMVQQADMRVDGTPVAIASRMDATATLKVGAKSPDGQYQAVLSYDSFAADATMNGQPAPLPVPDVAGRAFTLTFAADGRLTSVEPSGPRDEMALQMVRAMLDQMFTRADRTIAVGETAAIPIARSMGFGGMAATSNGQLALTLKSIARENGERIARFDQRIESSTAADAGAAPITTRMSGSGTTSWNLDRGFVQASDVVIALEGDVMQSKLVGTITIKTTGAGQ